MTIIEGFPRPGPNVPYGHLIFKVSESSIHTKYCCKTVGINLKVLVELICQAFCLAKSLKYSGMKLVIKNKTDLALPREVLGNI